MYIRNDQIIAISTAHLHPRTIAWIEQHQGNLPAGPSVGIREEGFFVNSYLGDADAVETDLTGFNGKSLYSMAPDLVLLRALARGQRAAWLNIDRDAPIYDEFLPFYDEDTLHLPHDPNWAEGLSDTKQMPSGHTVVIPSREVLHLIEAGKSPTDELGVDDDALVF